MTEEEKQELESVHAELEVIDEKLADPSEPLQWVYVARIQLLRDRLKRAIARRTAKEL